ncbi:MAG: hypothetical protein ACFFCD_16420 [Promethearchaeota archaeon]
MQKVHIKWPNRKDFAFTIIDDTDNSFTHNVKPVYRLLKKCNILTTKTVWVFPPRDTYTGSSLEDKNYLEFVTELMKDGFEIALHNVGSGKYTRDEIKEGIERFNELLGFYPHIQINHASNPDNIYWGYKRFAAPLSWVFKWFKSRRKFFGENPNSKYFWGDLAKTHIKYIRNRVFNSINTYKYDPYMPYKVRSKDKYSNYWFSSSDGHTVHEFNNLIEEENVNSLEREGGCCIVYTHFASGFVTKDGQLNRQFERNILRLAGKKGWFVPVGQLLDFLLSLHGTNNRVKYSYLAKLDATWLVHRIMKKLIYNR